VGGGVYGGGMEGGMGGGIGGCEGRGEIGGGGEGGGGEGLLLATHKSWVFSTAVSALRCELNVTWFSEKEHPAGVPVPIARYTVSIFISSPRTFAASIHEPTSYRRSNPSSHALEAGDRQNCPETDVAFKSWHRIPRIMFVGFL